MNTDKDDAEKYRLEQAKNLIWKIRIKHSPGTQKKMLASALTYLLTVFDSDAKAMYDAIAKYRTEQEANIMPTRRMP